MTRRSNFEDAIRDLEAALALFQSVRAVESTARTHLARARATRQAGSMDEAMAILDEGRAYSAEYEMRELEARFVMETATIFADTGEIEKARPLVKEARTLFASLSDLHPAIEQLDRFLAALSKSDP